MSEEQNQETDNQALDITEFRASLGESEPGDYQVVQETILASNNCFWQPIDFPERSPDRVQKAMAKLVADKELVRIIRGLYWRGVRDEGDNIILPPSIDITKKVLSLDSGIGYTGSTAFRKLGLKSADPETSDTDKIHIAIPYRAPRRVPNTVFVNRLGATGRVEAELNIFETTFLETLYCWPKLNLDRRADERIKELFVFYATEPEPNTGMTLEPEKLVAAARTEKAIVRDSLINLLRFSGSDLIRGVMPVRKRNYTPGIPLRQN